MKRGNDGAMFIGELVKALSSKVNSIIIKKAPFELR